MVSHIKLVRAVGAEFVARKLRATLLLAGAAAGLFAAVSVALTSQSTWWWLLAAPACLLLIIVVVLLCIARSLLKLLRPTMSKAHQNDVKQFTDKMERVAGALHTPLFIIVFRIIKDILWPQKRNYIMSLAKDSTTLHTDLLALQKKLNQP